MSELNQSKRQPCLIYSRVCGWFVPTVQMNKGKIEEYKDRLEYDVCLQSKS